MLWGLMETEHPKLESLWLPHAHSLVQDLREPCVQLLVTRFMQEVCGEEQKAFDCIVVPCSV